MASVDLETIPEEEIGPDDKVVELRGVLLQLAEEVLYYDGPPLVREYLLEGPAGTGKSTAWMYLLYLLCENCPGVRFLVARKYRRSLGESFCEPFEKFVCTGDEPFLGPAYTSRTSYDWANGSAIVLGGLDQPGNLYSTMFDGVVLQEAWQVLMEKIDPFYRALRRFHTPLNFLLLDTNPRHRRHPLNQRGDNGKVVRLKSKHEDNPRYFNADGTKTPEGVAYMQGLDALPEGSNLWLWLRKGEWSGAEGLFYPDFSEERNCIDPPPFLPGSELRDWKKFEIDYWVMSIDWGWRDPGCLQVWGISESGYDGIPNAGFLVAEWYHSKKGIDWWCDRAVEAYFEFPPVRAIVCDHNPDAINRLNIMLGSRGVVGSRRDEVPRIARNADKDFDRGGRADLAGTDLVRQLIGGERNAPPRLFIVNGFERCVDQELKKAHLPMSFLDEIWGYIYRQPSENGTPMPYEGAEQVDPSCFGKDNSMDTTRYAMNFAFRRNLHPAPQQTRHKPGTIGWVTREDEKLFPKQAEDIVTRKRREMLERMEGKRR